MPLYHISCREYEIGQVLPIRNNPSRFHQRREESGDSWINDVLDEYAPDGTPSRSRAYYAFENIGHCLFYFKDYPCFIDNAHIIYEVILENSVSAPMVLTDLLLSEGRNSENVEAICNEYWNPDEDWKIIEHLGESMQIVRRVENTFRFLMGKGRVDYQLDIETRKNYLNRLQN